MFRQKKSRSLVAIAVISFVVATVVGQDPGGNEGGIDDRAYLTNCSIEYISRPLLHAAESGRLIVAPREGDLVEAGAVVAETDTSIAQMQLRVKVKEYESERRKCESDIEVRYSQAQVDVAKASYDDAADANRKVKNAVSPNEIRKRRFEVDAGELRVEKSRNDREILKTGALVKLREVELAEAMMKMHKITSPVTGIIEAPSSSNGTVPLKHVGEWVRPGDVIAQVTQTDRLRIVGSLEAHKCNRKALIGNPVKITIPVLGTDQMKSVDAEIVHVGTNIDSTSGEIEIWAEIDNADGSITPGQFKVSMEFDLN